MWLFDLLLTSNQNCTILFIYNDLKIQYFKFVNAYHKFDLTDISFYDKAIIDKQNISVGCKIETRLSR